MLENNGITPAFPFALLRDELREGKDTQLGKSHRGGQGLEPGSRASYSGLCNLDCTLT